MKMDHLNPSSTQQQFEPPLSVIHKKRRRSSSNIHTSTSNTPSNSRSSKSTSASTSSQPPKGHNKNDGPNTSSSSALNYKNVNNNDNQKNNQQQTQPQDQIFVEEQIVFKNSSFKKSRKSFTIQEKLNHVFQYKLYLQQTNNNQQQHEQQHKNMAAWLRNHNHENGTNIGRSTFYKWYQTFDHEVQITNVENACSSSSSARKNNQGVVGNMNCERKSRMKNQAHSKPIEKIGGHYKKRMRIRPYHGMLFITYC